MTPAAVAGIIAAAVVLAFAWLFYAARGGRPVKVKIKGLGIEVAIDTSAKALHESTAQKEKP